MYSCLATGQLISLTKVAVVRHRIEADAAQYDLAAGQLRLRGMRRPEGFWKSDTTTMCAVLRTAMTILFAFCVFLCVIILPCLPCGWRNMHTQRIPAMHEGSRELLTPLVGADDLDDCTLQSLHQQRPQSARLCRGTMAACKGRNVHVCTYVMHVTRLKLITRVSTRVLFADGTFGDTFAGVSPRIVAQDKDAHCEQLEHH
jgi:hypothetical protein